MPTLDSPRSAPSRPGGGRLPHFQSALPLSGLRWRIPSESAAVAGGGPPPRGALRGRERLLVGVASARPAGSARRSQDMERVIHATKPGDGYIWSCYQATQGTRAQMQAESVPVECEGARILHSAKPIPCRELQQQTGPTRAAVAVLLSGPRAEGELPFRRGRGEQTRLVPLEELTGMEYLPG